MRNFVERKFISVFLIAVLILANFSSTLAITVNAETSQDLFISEYIEGSSYNKAIEIYNGTGNEVDLSTYSLELYTNGGSSPNSTMTLSGTLASGEVYVLANSRASADIMAVTDETGSVINFNGDDAIVLKNNDSVVDSFGQVGVDPGSAWGSDVSTANSTLVRNTSILAGDTNPSDVFDPSVEWTGFAQDDFSHLGSHLKDTTEEPTEPKDLYTIEEARSLEGQTVTVEGLVLSGNLHTSQLSNYIQDDTAGINLFNFDASIFTELEEGDKVKVTGKITVYNDLTEIVPSSSEDLEVISKDNALPEPVEISIADLQDASVAEPLEGQLVKVSGYISNIPDSPAGGGYNISFVDANFQGTTLRVIEGTLDLTALEVGWYDVTAILSQYNSYQLIPRKDADIKLADEQPEAPTAAGEYTSTVMYVTDGDTIRLNSPVLGADRVRFVNIDTPETDMGSANGAHGDNQDQHGEAASAYLKTLLQEGDEVTLKVGEEPTDAYGRLLAQVINKDGINTNLEMVEKGYAVSYFIWPVGDEAEYELYQSATRLALDNELGIWDPADPLIELPFEYRAILEGGDFHRYVGNSDTKEYVQPLEWEDVSVDKRIFFASAEEAEAQGYTAVGSDPVDPPSEDVLELQLLSMNDLHGKIDQEYELDIDDDGTDDGMFGRMDYTSAFIKDRAQENPNTLIVHAGDMIGGSSPVSGLYQDEPTVEIMEEIGFDFGTVGNHEFDEGTDELLRMVNGGEHPEGLGTADYDGIDFANLCANCVYKDSGETILPPYAVAEVDGEKIGFIGVNTQASASMVMPAGIEDIEFTDEAAAVNKAVSELKADGVEAIVVLAHMPADQSGASATGDSANLANSVDDAVDIIFAAHNHQVVDAVVDNKLIVQASEYGKAFADVDIQIDRTTGDIVNKEAEIVFVDQSVMGPDPAVTNILEKYAALIADKMNEVLGYNANTMTGSYTGDGDHGLGNLIADAMLYSMGSDFAMMNGGGIRDQLLEGEVTWGNLYNIMPFGNTLMEFEVTGADLYTILNEQISAQYGPDYSVSGMKYTWDSTTNEVIDIMFMDGTLIEEDTTTYTLTVNNYMGTSEGPIKDLGQNEIMGPMDLDSFVDFVKSLESTENNPIDYGPEGRIVEIEDDSEEDLGEVTIAEARAAEMGTKVTVEGIVTTTPGAWGSNGFYLQDDTGGTYVFGDDSVSVGDSVKLTAKAASYNGEFQLSDVSELEITGNSDFPTALDLSPAEIDDTNQGQLVVVKGATISSLEEVNDYGTFEFIATQGDDSVLVRVDNRTGLAFSDFTFTDGDVVDITGISSVFNGEYQLKPTQADDIVEHIEDEPSEQEEQITVKPQVTNGKAKIDTNSIDQVKDQGELVVDVGDGLEVDLDLDSGQVEKLKAKGITLTIKNSETTVSIPSNILPSGAVSIKVEVVTDVEGSEGAVTKVFDFTINNGEIHEFTEPVTLKFLVDASKVSDDSRLEVRYFNEATGEWESIGGTYEGGFVTAQTSHFSKFAVFEIAQDDDKPDEEKPGDDSNETPEPEPEEDNSDESDKGDGSSEDEDSDSDEELPGTSTNTFNILLVGVMLIFAGMMFVIYHRRKTV
ncbi:hypothetical protein GH741_16340 [Aquibacillus halophilus]|uniref:LPXTG cell wall anchor domain-containing protein n=1 Tax=Aquibacillus halophilus TaxID=930132 RepID=A0A6A8DEY6_9BACI|nr:5'-nucleotidase C-terminal domain-containing protein [Aquibacillus halophilus]MRH44213.1 hypothetical protein [Aquibacillus halophilus]